MRKDEVEALFAEYYNDALLYSLSLTRDRAEAEDIVAHAFFRALSHADDSITSFKPWLLRVCRNAYFNRHRVKKRKRELTESMADDRESALDAIIRDEEYQALYRAIDLLQPFQREVLTLFYYENLHVKDIAEITGKTEILIRVTLCRARDKIKQILEVKK